MDLQEAAEILRSHNEWRRDDSAPAKRLMQSPEELGVAIDTVLAIVDAIGKAPDPNGKKKSKA
jgi:hypothetical protein